MRIVFVPQFPSKLRYQEWWFTELPKQFRQRGFEVITLGEKYVESIEHKRSKLDMFSPIDEAIEFESEQIKEYIALDLRPDDILFWSDISFPGLFGHVLFHKRPSKMFAFCHATSINKYDYYQSVKEFKYPIEENICKLFNKVFVGSEYHKAKLGWNNLQVTYLPFQPYEGKIETFVPKTHTFMSASRVSPQKVDMPFEIKIERICEEQIFRPVNNTWEEYFANLRSSKFLLITAHEDTFGYQIVDAVTNNCIPLARNGLAYPELLPRKYLYDDLDDLMIRIDCIEAGEEEEPAEIPRLLCEYQMRDFYNVICKEMRGK